MKTISQRELRNDNAVVMRAVEEGETFTVTRRGVPVARLAPVEPEEDLRCVRRAAERPPYSEWRRLVIGTPSAAVLDDLRGDR